jgi:hypothetical protein
MDHRLVELFTPSSLVGGLFSRAMCDVISAKLGNEYKTDDTSKALKYMDSMNLFPFAVSLVRMRNEVIHNRTDSITSIEKILELLYQIQSEMDVSMIFLDSLIATLENSEKSNSFLRVFENGFKQGESYIDMEFEGTFIDFAKKYPPHQLKGRKIRVGDTDFLFHGWKGRTVKFGNVHAQLDETFSLLSTKGAQMCEPISLYFENGVYHREPGEGREEFKTKHLHIFNCTGVEDRSLYENYFVDGFEDETGIYIRNQGKLCAVSKIEEKFEEGSTTFEEYRSTRTKDERMLLKGKKIRITEGKHKDRIATFGSWSGTTVKVKFLDGMEETLSVNLKRHFKVV